VGSSVISTTSEWLCIIELRDAEVEKRKQRFVMFLVMCTMETIATGLVKNKKKLSGLEAKVFHR
jgi:hypothetical protein